MEQELRTEKLHVEKADEGLTCVLRNDPVCHLVCYRVWW